MSFLNWTIDSLASDDIIDLYFVLSELLPLDLTQSEWTQQACNDARAMARLQGITIRNGHAFDADGKDLGPVGKLVL